MGLHEENLISSFSITPYENCIFQCKYCYLVKVFGDDFGRYLRPRPEVLEEICHRRHSIAGESWILSAHTDPYPPLEKRELLTRRSLEALASYHAGQGTIITKSPLVTRDIDILSSFSTPVCVSFSIGTDDDSVSKQLEPGAPPPSQRLAAAQVLRSHGIPVQICVSPILKHPPSFARALSMVADLIFIDTTPDDVWSRDAQPDDKLLLLSKYEDLVAQLSDYFPAARLSLGRAGLLRERARR